MGQYHYLVNLSKKEFVHPHQIGNGLKMHEQVGWQYSTSTVLAMLLAASCQGGGRGGGDFRSNSELVGSWAGDKIAFIGDYAEKDDVPGCDASKIYKLCEIAYSPEDYTPSKEHGATAAEVVAASQWKNITAKVREMMAEEFSVEYSGEGWMNIKKKGEANPQSPAMAPDLIINTQ